MKKLTIVFVLFSFIGFPVTGTAQESNQVTDPQEKIEQTGKDTLSFTVYGMDCPGCEGGLEKQINKIPSVKESDAFWMTQKLVVIMKADSVLNLEDLKQRVKKANFTLDLEKKEGSP